jgi:MFS transporter, ACDE family, multidrug resistance protein
VTSIDPRARAVATWVLLAARVVYAFSWYDVGGVLPLVGDRFGVGTVELGVVLAAFLVGAAIFQLPAGYVAMRWGNRTTSVVALGVMGIFAFASGFSPSWVVLAMLRFGAGGGAAFFFAPALGLVTAYYPGGHRGFVVGGFNAGFSVGSGIGLFASASLGPVLGWAFPLEVGGGLLLAISLGAALLLPATPGEAKVPARELWSASRPLFRSRGLWGIALGGGGLWGGFYIAAQYFVTFAHAIHPGWSLALAAAAPTVMIALEVPGGPLGGWFGERSPDMRRALVAWAIVAGVLLAAVPLLSLSAELTAFAVLGFADGVTFTLLYLIPTYLPEVTAGRVALGLALVNFVQILLGSAIALGFAFVAETTGYLGAWVFAGVATIAFLPALALSGVQDPRPAIERPA